MGIRITLGSCFLVNIPQEAPFLHIASSFYDGYVGKFPNIGFSNDS